MPFGSISPQQLFARITGGQHVDLIDVRTPAEYARSHAVGARPLPLEQITPEAVRTGRPADATGPTYVICQSGGRSRQACQHLVEGGVTEVVNVEGGTGAWKAAGLPIEAPAGSVGIGLPAWVRGSGLLLVVVSLLLAWQVRPWFAYAALGIWLLLLIAGRGACPLGSCSVPPQPQEKA